MYEGLTFEVRGGQKAQPFGRPLDRRVRALVAEAYELDGLKHSWPKHTTTGGEMRAWTAATAFAVAGSVSERGAGATRSAPPWRRNHFLTTQRREAQPIDRLFKEREAPFTG